MDLATDARAFIDSPQVYQDVSYRASNAIGIDVTKGFAAPYWQELYDKGADGALQFIAAAEKYPDETADMIKEKSSEFADSFAAALKQRAEKRKSEQK